jgi:class 3 adenylate cyclase
LSQWPEVTDPNESASYRDPAAVPGGAGTRAVRAGLHTGECEVRGNDIDGIAVHIGARASALAGGNDVLVSGTLRDLVIGSGLEFEERGAYKLRVRPANGISSPPRLRSGGLRRN